MFRSVIRRHQPCLRLWPKPRTFTASSACRSSVIYAGLKTAPTPEYIEAEELDVELPQNPQLRMTDRTAEVRQLFSLQPLHLISLQQLRAISMRQGNPNSALRIAVESGGCHGYQYKMLLETQSEDGD